MKYIIFSLGNPGNEYAKTRHNAARIAFSSVDFSGVHAEYVEPDCYMNESGVYIKNILKYKNDIQPIVTYDDKDLSLGHIKISFARNDGGHNGVKSVIQELGTKDFIRIRIGIGEKSHPEMLLQDYVLSKLSDEEIKILKSLNTKLEEIINTIVSDGYEKAMERYN